MAKRPTNRDQTGARWPAWVETWVMPYVWEKSLWPVLFAIMGHVVVVFAMQVLTVVRGTWRDGLAGLTLSLGATAWLLMTEWRVNGRPGGVTLTLVLTWATAAALAWWAGGIGLI